MRASRSIYGPYTVTLQIRYGLNKEEAVRIVNNLKRDKTFHAAKLGKSEYGYGKFYEKVETEFGLKVVDNEF